MILTESELQYFHSWLNHRYFDGKLQAAVVKIVSRFAYNEQGINGVFIHDTTPYRIDIFVIQESYAKPDDKVYVIRILLHEMIHQYCRENGINDHDHNEAFRTEAEKRGMCRGGYALTGSEAMEIQKALESFEQIRRMWYTDIP